MPTTQDRTDELSPHGEDVTRDEPGPAAFKEPDSARRHGPTPSQPGSRQPAWRRLLHHPASGRGRLALASAYAAPVLALGAFYFYRDYHSADAHLARAASAKLRHRRDRALAEYAAALRLADDPHTRQLLALELSAAGRHEEALAHLQAARAVAEPDEALPFHLGAALEALDRPAEAAAEYRTFLESDLCRREPPDPRCDAARSRLSAVGPNAPR